MSLINNFNDLMIALQSGQKQIVIGRNITCNHSLVLPEGVTLKGEPQENGELPMLLFRDSDGVGLTVDNSLVDIKINAPVDQRAIYTTVAKEDLGVLRMENLSVHGQISIITRIGVQSADIVLSNVDIIAADARHYLEQPQKYGVNVLQGAFTVYNMNGDENSLVRVRATQLTVGRKDAPVLGSGIFIAGFGDQGGRVEVSLLETGAVHSTGKIPFGVADFITGGVFILNGAHAQEVVTNGELVTYGVNDMVTDVWGSVDNWTSNQPITSYGPSGIGFVNFGVVKNYTVNAPIQTYGLGARGYNQYDGTVEHISFKSIETFGDGSVGVQISREIGTLTIEEDLITHGSVGNTLVKGVIIQLPAYALSIKEGGAAKSITIKGDVKTYGDDVTTIITEKGSEVKKIEIQGKVEAHGNNANTKLVDQ